MPDHYGYDNDRLNIVMFNMSTFYDWDHGVVNRNYHILKNLAEHERVNKIIGVDFLPVGWRKGIKHYWQNILSEIKTAEMVYGDLTSACYQRSDKIYAYTTIDSIFSFKIVANELRRIEKMLNLRNIIFWSYNPMFIEFIGRLNELLFVFDTVDNWAEHPTYTKLISKKRLLDNYKTISEKANLIFTVSDELREFYKGLGRETDTHWVPNGVDFEHFNNPEKNNKENRLTKIKQPIIGYLGTIESRVDLDLIAQIAEANKDKTIALCGPIWPIISHDFQKKLGQQKNIIATGRINYEDAPSYLHQFTAAIIPHKLNGFIASTNPMKLYEYLAAGISVVSTRGAGVEMFKDHIYIADNNQQFINFISEAIKSDSAERKVARQNAAKKHSWKSRIDQMTELLFAKLQK